jgi:hypothetical protein
MSFQVKFEPAGLRMALGSPLLSTLDRMNIGGVLLDAGGGVVDINDPARRVLNGKSNRPDHASSPEV